MIIEGQEYNLRLDLTAFSDFEKASGKNILKILSDFMRRAAGFTADNGAELLPIIIEETDLQVTDLQILLWAALGGKDGELDVRQAGRLLNTHNFVEVGGALVDALMEALPSGGGGEPVADSDDPTQSPTG
jgi:hypothetical protein